MKLPTISYGSAILIVSAIIQYMGKPGIENCNSMVGGITMYTSHDYSLGCQILSNIQIGTIVTEIIGAIIITIGIFSKPKIK